MTRLRNNRIAPDLWWLNDIEFALIWPYHHHIPLMMQSWCIAPIEPKSIPYNLDILKAVQCRQILP